MTKVDDFREKLIRGMPVWKFGLAGLWLMQVTNHFLNTFALDKAKVNANKESAA
jgi:hypothetical protein